MSTNGRPPTTIPVDGSCEDEAADAGGVGVMPVGKEGDAAAPATAASPPLLLSVSSLSPSSEEESIPDAEPDALESLSHLVQVPVSEERPHRQSHPMLSAPKSLKVHGSQRCRRSSGNCIAGGRGIV